MINMWWTFSLFDEVWINFGEKFYAVETAWTVQRNSSIISKEIHEACHFFIIFLFWTQWQHFLVNFFWNSDAFLLHVHWNSSEFLLLLLHFLQFLCISEKILGISYEFLMNFLCISYVWFSYAILMQFLQLHTFLAKVYEALKLHKKCIRIASNMHKNCIRNA